MKVVGKILKILVALLAVVGLFLIFWYGVFTATGVAEVPVPLPVGLLEPPDVSVSEHLYDRVSVEMDGVKYNNALGFPLYSKESFHEDGTFNRDIAEGYQNKLEDNKYYMIDDYEENTADALEQALYLFKIASYNEKMVTNYAFFQESGGTATIQGIEGDLMSQALQFVNRTFDDTVVGKYSENLFYQQVNALNGVKNAPEFLKSLAKNVLMRAERKLSYGDDYYFFKDAFSPTFVSYDDPSLTEDVRKYYQPFLATGNLTVAAGRGTADWTGKVLSSKREDVTRLALEKYIGNYDQELTAKQKQDGYLTFQDVFKLKFILNNLTSEFFYDDYGGENGASVSKVWVDKYGNATDESGNAYTESSPEAVRFYFDCRMVADVSKVNANPEYIAALREYTSANPVLFTKLEYRFSVWDTGLMRHWHTLEGWDGTLMIVNGVTHPNNPTYYSYSKANTYIEDFVKYAVGEARAEKLYGITYADGITYKDGKIVHDTTKDVTYFDKSRVPALKP